MAIKVSHEVGSSSSRERARAAPLQTSTRSPACISVTGLAAPESYCGARVERKPLVSTTTWRHLHRIALRHPAAVGERRRGPSALALARSGADLFQAERVARRPERAADGSIATTPGRQEIATRFQQLRRTDNGRSSVASSTASPAPSPWPDVLPAYPATHTGYYVQHPHTHARTTSAA